MHVPIDPDRKYSPKEIKNNKFILNHVGKPDYRYVLELIKGGKIKASCTTQGNRKFYDILGADIIKWKNSTYNIPEQPNRIILQKNEKKPFPQPYDTNIHG